MDPLAFFPIVVKMIDAIREMRPLSLQRTPGFSLIFSRTDFLDLRFDAGFNRLHDVADMHAHGFSCFLRVAIFQCPVDGLHFLLARNQTVGQFQSGQANSVCFIPVIVDDGENFPVSAHHPYDLVEKTVRCEKLFSFFL